MHVYILAILNISYSMYANISSSGSNLWQSPCMELYSLIEIRDLTVWVSSLFCNFLFTKFTLENILSASAFDSGNANISWANLPKIENFLLPLISVMVKHIRKILSHYMPAR